MNMYANKYRAPLTVSEFTKIDSPLYITFWI